MIRWFAKNDVAANLLLVAILLGGIWTAMTRVPLQVSPTYQHHTVVISMNYKGGTAKDVEESILIPIEEAVADLPGIDRCWARATRGRGFFWVRLKANAGKREMLEEIQSRIDRINTFPGETEKPVVRLPNSDAHKDVLGIAITGDLNEPDLLRAAERVRDDLVAMEGISQAGVEGGRAPEFSIELDQVKLRAFGLTFRDISDAIRRFSVDLPAGSIRGESGNLSVRALGQAKTVEDYAAIPLRASEGMSLTLGEVATITDGYAGGRSIIRFNGTPGLVVRVMRHDLESALEISDLVHDYAATVDERFPPGIGLFVWDDESEAIRSRLGTLTTSLLQGCLLVFIMLALFLRPAIAFWVVVGIPVSFAGGVIMMPILGVTANLMSLFGFIIVVGLVVDDAIVTGENIYSKLKEGMDPLEASVIGTKEVATPVTFGILTTIAAFMPLMFFEGHWGNFAKQIPVIVAPVLLFSLVESKLVLPSHLKYVRTGRSGSNPLTRIQQGIAASLEWFVARVYRPSLNFALHHRYSVCASFFAMALLMFGYFKGGHIDFITIPSVERNLIVARLKLPGGIRLAETAKYVERIEAGAWQIREEFQDGNTGDSLVANIYAITGESGYWGGISENAGLVMAELLVPSKRSVPGPSVSEVAERWQEIVGDIPEAQRFSIMAEKSGHSRSVDLKQTEPMQIEVRGQGSEEKVELVQEVVELLRNFEGIGNAHTQVGRGMEELEISLRPRAAELGLTQQFLARQIRHAFYGEEAQRLQRGTDDISVMVRLNERERESLHTLDTLMLQAPGGAVVSLASVANVRRVTAPRSIERIDGAEVIEITANPDDLGVDIIGLSETIAPEIQAILNKGDNLSFRYTGYIAESKRAKKRTLLAGLGLIFVLFSLLAIPFKSFVQPIFVLLAVPFGIIGAVLGHLIMDITPSYLSVFGMLALAGVVVNDSLVMVDFINRKREQGASLHEAITSAGARRFRPILLTSMTTFVGLVPLMFDKSIEGQFLIPMAVSLGYGIIFATAITLYLIPCAYQIAEDLGGILGRTKAWYFRPFSGDGTGA